MHLLKSYKRFHLRGELRVFRIVRIATASVTLLLVGSLSYAWGPKGHRIVALVADAHLSASAKQGIAVLLEAETDPRVHSLPDAAVWPDLIKNDRPETKEWHFVDILVTDTHFDPNRDCPGANHADCIIARIAQFRATLADSSAATAQRLEALKFITHFIGDLHQPLHCADNHDRGGNDVNVKWFGKKMNLHALWDSGIINKAGLDEEDFAAELLDNITSAQLPNMQAGTVIEWAEASHTLAKTHAYKITQNHMLGQAYYNANADTVDDQLTKAGLPLARILNESFQ